VPLITRGAVESLRPAQRRTGPEYAISPRDQALAVSLTVPALTLSKQELQ
jgi:hypothetical protein